jgi:hypothetical protein
VRRAWIALPWLAGCGSWPRWSATEDTPELSPSEADASFEWGDPFEEAEGSNDGPDASPLTLSTGNTALGEGALDGVGWCSADNGPACENVPDAACAVPFGDPTGVYAGDIDTWGIAVEGEGDLTLCARAQVDPSGSGEEAVFDLLLVPLGAEGCPMAPTAGTGDHPLGWSLGPGAAGWGAPVTAGSRVAVLLAGALAVNDGVTEVFPYQIGLALVPSAADGGLTHCPLLPGETAGESE